jgi:hypothetical protein
MAKPVFTAAQAVSIGGFGTAEDGSDIVRRFKRGAVVEDAESKPGLLGLVVSGYLKPGDDEAIALVEQLKVQG